MNKTPTKFCVWRIVLTSKDTFIEIPDQMLLAKHTFSIILILVNEKRLENL